MIASALVAPLLAACVSEGDAAPNDLGDSASSSIASPAAPATVLVEDPQQWRDLGGHQLVFLDTNGTPPATGWKGYACGANSVVAVSTYLPGMARAGTFLVFKTARASLPNFERYWQLTAGAPPMSPATTQVLDRLPYITRSQTAAVTLGDALVNGVVIGGGFASRCYQRTSATAPFASSYEFNATPGTGTVSAGDGRPYITEICDSRDFAFVEVYVP